MRIKVVCIVSFLILSIGLITAQTSPISGVVVDVTGESIIGVSVAVKGTTNGTITDGDGKFSISVSDNEDILVFSLVGMRVKELKASNNMKVVMEDDARLLDEVVVTGYGVTRKAAFTGAASVLGQANIENRNDPNAIKSLEGSVAGLQMNINSGQPGAPVNVYIRGRNSINSGTQPLYVIDGVPISSDVVGVRQDEGQQLSPLSTISASDIESITVLKDATATSIYGARASNGVIVITTKQGKSGKTSVAFTTKLGFETSPHINSRYRTTNRDQNIELATEALLNEYKVNGPYNPTTGKGSVVDRLNGGQFPYTTAGMTDFYADYTGFDMNNNTDWFDAVTRTGLIQEYGLEVQSGGANATSPKYYLSFNYFDNKAMIVGKDLNRYSFRFNLDQAPSKFFKFGLNTNLSYTQINMGAGGGYFTDPITQSFMQSPLTPVKNADGEWNFDTVNGYNPVAQRSENGDRSLAKQYRAILSPYIQLNLDKHFVFISRLGADIYNVDEFGYWSFLQPQGLDTRGFGENGNTMRTLLTTTNTLNYINTLKEKHNINILLGQEGQKTLLKETYLAASNYPVDYLNEVGNAAIPTDASTERSELVLGSFFSNFQYDYDSKYYVSSSFRYDGSSRFGKNNRYASFWSLGGKYRLTAEDFMSSTKQWLDNLTIRSSYGTTGNQDVGILRADNTLNSPSSAWYVSRDLFGFGNNYNSLPGSGHSQFGNPDLKWEQTAKFNVGIDVSLFNFLSIEADYYMHKTTDMVFAVPTSLVTGLNSYYKNIGELSNKGFEVSINAQLVNKKDFKWSVTAVGSINKNKVEKLSTDLPIETVYAITEVGRPLNQFKMKEWAGVDPKTGVGTWYLNETGSETTTDYNRAAKRYLGDPNPKFIGSFNTSLKWKDFDLMLQLNYSLGAQIYGNNLRYDEQVGASWFENYTSYVYDNRWQKEGDIALVPRLTAFGTGFSNSHSSRFLMNGNYLKIRSLALGYNIPKALIKKAFMNNARVFVNAENLYTFTAKDYRGFDPSGVGSNGVQWWNYPTPTTVVFGLTFGF